MREVEIKLRIRNERTLRKSLKRCGARPVHAAGKRLWQYNVLFDTPKRGLARKGQLLRIRTERLVGAPGGKPMEEHVLVTFKRPVSRSDGLNSRGRARHRIREEMEVRVADGSSLTKIFESLGLTGWFRYERYRTTFALPAEKKWGRGLLIELDETPIGTFVELEGPPEAIDRAARELGFSKRDYILKNYLVLYLEDCRKRRREPKHMLFEPLAGVRRKIFGEKKAQRP